MGRSKIYTTTLLTCGASVLATSLFALPTELGRSADVHENAVRYFETLSGDAMARGPKPRPEPFDEVVIVAAPDQPVVENGAFAPEQPSVPVTAKIDVSDKDGAFQGPLVPHDIASFAVQTVTADDALAIPLTPLNLAVLDTETSPETADVVTAAFGVAPTQASARSSRLFDPTKADLIPVSGGTGEPHLDGDFMDAMAAADSNFTIREGEEDRPDTMMMSSDVLFAFGKAALAAEAEVTLKVMTEMLTSVSKVEVFGHTDAIGTESNNLSLGQKRAEVVRDWLLANSTLNPEQVVATGVGETDPVAANFTGSGDDNPTGRAQNRRVEFAFW